LKSVIHFPINVEGEEGSVLSDVYKVGTTYPVFILMNSSGEIIKRWTGYSTATAFVGKLKSSLSDLASIDERLARFKASPTFQDALGLAKFYSDIGENLQAIEFYQHAVSLGKGTNVDFTYQIFMNTANASWKEMLPFEDVLPTADAVLSAKRKNVSNIVKVSQIMARLARKLGRTDEIAKYLQAGIDVTANSQDPKTRESHNLAKADYALHVEGDATKAVSIRKAGLGAGWEDNRDKFYAFAKWCLERKINLEEAEMYARKTINMVYPGKIRAKVLNIVAEICFARGKTAEAIKTIGMAIEQEPENEFYPKQLKRFQESLDR
jgi:tetratricopeptide (TPR) repeat protein